MVNTVCDTGPRCGVVDTTVIDTIDTTAIASNQTQLKASVLETAAVRHSAVLTRPLEY